MRFLIDAQLPPALCRWFEDKSHEAEHVMARLGWRSPDAAITDHSVERILSGAL